MDKLYANNIYKTKNEFVLDIKQLTILKNKTNVILGENGAGKSTLANYILENDTVFEGYKKTLLTQASYTFNRSCLKNVEMILKWNNNKQNALDFLKLVHLEHKKETKGKELSGGEKKRLALAMALATDSDIILLDEPFASIDAKNQNQMIEIINSLKGVKTVIIVSHRIDLCQRFGDLFMKMENGKIIEYTEV